MAPRKDIEATISTYENYGKNAITSSNHFPFNVVGKVGKWSQAIDVGNGLNEFTGSRAGVSGITVLTHGSAVVHLTAGGSIPASELEDKGSIHELSISKITAASSAAITVFR